MLACAAVLVACVGCGTVTMGAGRIDRPDPGRLRVASFDFPESRLLAELYGQYLRQAGFTVDVLAGVGTREAVEPALEQGMVDIVLEYTGSLLDFLGGSVAETHGTSDEVHAAVRQRLSPRGLTAADYAPAEDANGFAVRAAFARDNGLSRLSDLRDLAGRLSFGGPPECPTRRYCLRGLQETYGLHFAAFRPQPSRAATATALESGDIDVGLMETTYGRLGDRRMTLLIDDRNLQPRENVVPVIRTEVVRRYGARLTDALDALSSRLTTGDLIRLNRAALINPLGPADVAAAYLGRLGR
ncbi:MAG TPA: ABC transporter substrate-binding protein [Mycobacteriales bacterium]|nr:ABC transporter substrate-binding protein [Mycobacteriales bacterium]